MKFNDAVFGGVLLVLGLAVLGVVQGYPKIPGQNVGPALFPGLIATGLVVCALLLIASGMRERGRVPWFEALPWVSSKRHVVAFATLIASVILYIALVDRIGFLIVAPLMLLAMFISFRVRPGAAVVVAIVASLVIWYAFYKLLRVPLPWGVLERFAF
ncbi:MAG TPA: tripartite tricarboxylate transporter TctB family protein [Casimicrobiaceae bacterium]|jgi:putative tricarboxylic transport membrane protein